MTIQWKWTGYKVDTKKDMTISDTEENKFIGLWKLVKHGKTKREEIE